MLDASSLQKIQEGLEQNRKMFPLFAEAPACTPDPAKVVELLRMLRSLIFPGYFRSDEDYFRPFSPDRESLLQQTYLALHALLQQALCLQCGMGEGDLRLHSKRIATQVLEALPFLQAHIAWDVEAIFHGDPAARSREEVVVSYPSLFAIFTYRVAHVLWDLDVPLLPRMMTEYAHHRTGIDIHPGASIGRSFFIDHGTGVVIGETTTIGDHVKIYQGVTLGAISLSEGRELQRVKRHPTVEDYVTLYANCTILGGETTIGAHSVIGGGAFVTSSVPANTRVLVEQSSLNLKTIKREEV